MSSNNNSNMSISALQKQLQTLYSQQSELEDVLAVIHEKILMDRDNQELQDKWDIINKQIDVLYEKIHNVNLKIIKIQELQDAS